MHQTNNGMEEKIEKGVGRQNKKCLNRKEKRYLGLFTSAF
jgi:hypothetical protein